MSSILNGLYLRLSLFFQDFMADEDGEVNIVTIVVLIGIAVLLAILFKDSISNLLKNLFNTIGGSASNVVTTPA